MASYRSFPCHGPITDPGLRRLYGAIYIAFRRRRSLLLLNLENQIKIEELPWVKVIDTYRKDALHTQEQARQTLEHVAMLAITVFPHQILPNKLLQEIRSLANSAGLRVPIVDEVAADIFMGEFSEKFLHAAQKAAQMLQGTVYERYYGISYAQVQQIDDIVVSRYGASVSSSFGKLCCEMAGETLSSGRWSVARNGKIIEQEQILTTHNLAVLFDSLGLVETLGPHLEDLARRCFEWICRRQQQKIDLWQARLRMVKNTAYAWRQMIFYLALLPADAVNRFLIWADDHLEKQRPEYQARFKPVLDGLALTVQGISLDDHSGQSVSVGARRFLGWTTEKHWLLA